MFCVGWVRRVGETGEAARGAFRYLWDGRASLQYPPPLFFAACSRFRTPTVIHYTPRVGAHTHTQNADCRTQENYMQEFCLEVCDSMHT